ALTYQALAAYLIGEPSASRAAAEEARELADALGDPVLSRGAREWLGTALAMQGNLTDAAQVLRTLVDEADAAQDRTVHAFCLAGLAYVLAFQGDAAAAHSAAQSALESPEAIGGPT